MADSTLPAGFNEAAGFTRRKRLIGRSVTAPETRRFNEAAGFTRRKRRAGQRGNDRRLGFNEAAGFTRRKPLLTAAENVEFHQLQ